VTKVSQRRSGIRFLVAFTVIFWGTVGVAAALLVTNYIEAH
jgi:hypothetical protein